MSELIGTFGKSEAEHAALEFVNRFNKTGNKNMPVSEFPRDDYKQYGLECLIEWTWITRAGDTYITCDDFWDRIEKEHPETLIRRTR